MSEFAEIGFDRPKTQQLPGSVKFYQRHLFVCTGETGWPSHIERSGGFIGALAELIAANEQEMSVRTRLNACDLPSTGAGWDVLVFPDQVRYLGLRESDLPTLMREHLAGNRVAESLPHTALSGQHVFVCVHESRDARCGACGPALLELFSAEIDRRHLNESVAIHRTSHVGGHEYAGNVLVYPGGDWYGYVIPADVPEIVERHILGGQIVVERWRGRMGLTPEEQGRWAVQQAQPPLRPQ